MCIKQFHKLCLIFVISATPFILSGIERDLMLAEEELMVLFVDLRVAGSYDARTSINNEIRELFSSILVKQESFFYPFDSLTSVGRLVSDDSLLRVFTWHISESPLDHNYYGFIQMRDSIAGRINLFYLDQKAKDFSDIEKKIFTVDNWYGAIYYQIKDVTWSGETYYTLMGFDFNNVFSNIKIIDVIYLAEGEPVFGAPVFNYGEVVKHRVVFEYSSGTVMFLRYVPEMNMIIYDHLAPASERFKGQFRYYGPDFSYDGLIFKEGRWIHVPDVDWKQPPDVLP